MPTSLIPAGAVTTVEEDPGDDTLNCTALRGSPVHDETQKAFQNLSGATTTNQKPAVIVGYGAPGSLCTGSACNSGLTNMNDQNESEWKDAAHLIQQSKFSKLTVLGCNVGQGDEGAAFVTELAQESQTRVRAPTGLVWCQDDSLFVEPGNQWVQGGPGQRAKPRVGPVHTVPVLDTYRLYVNGELRDVPAKATRVVQFHYVGFPPYGSGDINPDEAASLAKLLDLAHPFKQTARPLATLTARVELSITINGKQVTKRFGLYADAVLRDLEAKDLFYRADTRLHERLQVWRRRNLKPAHG